MKWQMRIAAALMCLAAMTSLTGCRYLTNRYYDFRDVLDLGAGVTAENAITGVIPPSIGIHAQVTDFVQLGWITHNGYSAETDMRGSFVGPESYTRAGFLWWGYYQKNQDYVNASYYNMFKDKDFLWCVRMESIYLAHYGRPAKRLHYEEYAPYAWQGPALLHQGWQYWGYTGLNVAICEPFLTHLGVMLRLGIDPSEFSDFLLGWFTIDFKHDDMLPEEFAEFQSGHAAKPEPAPGPMATATPAPAAPTPSTPLAPPIPANTVPAEPMRNVSTTEPLETIYFDYDRSAIRPDQVANMEKNLKYLQDNADANAQIIGHTDDRGTNEYNMVLGMHRAEAVRDWLVAKGIASSRLDIQSRGEEEPAAQGQNEEAWAKNRRAEVKKIVTIRTSTDPAAPAK